MTVIVLTVQDHFKLSERSRKKKFPQDLKNFLSKLVEMIRLSCNQVIILYIILQNKGVHFSSISLDIAKHKIVLFNKIEHINSSAVLWLFDCKKKRKRKLLSFTKQFIPDLHQPWPVVKGKRVDTFSIRTYIRKPLINLKITEDYIVDFSTFRNLSHNYH